MSRARPSRIASPARSTCRTVDDRIIDDDDMQFSRPTRPATAPMNISRPQRTLKMINSGTAPNREMFNSSTVIGSAPCPIFGQSTRHREPGTGTVQWARQQLGVIESVCENMVTESGGMVECLVIADLNCIGGPTEVVEVPRLQNRLANMVWHHPACLQLRLQLADNIPSDSYDAGSTRLISAALESGQGSGQMGPEKRRKAKPFPLVNGGAYKGLEKVGKASNRVSYLLQRKQMLRESTAHSRGSKQEWAPGVGDWKKGFLTESLSFESVTIWAEVKLAELPAHATERLAGVFEIIWLITERVFSRFAPLMKLLLKELRKHLYLECSAGLDVECSDQTNLRHLTPFSQLVEIRDKELEKVREVQSEAQDDNLVNYYRTQALDYNLKHFWKEYSRVVLRLWHAHARLHALNAKCVMQEKAFGVERTRMRKAIAKEGATGMWLKQGRKASEKLSSSPKNEINWTRSPVIEEKDDDARQAERGLDDGVVSPMKDHHEKGQANFGKHPRQANWLGTHRQSYIAEANGPQETADNFSAIATGQETADDDAITTGSSGNSHKDDDAAAGCDDDGKDSEEKPVVDEAASILEKLREFLKLSAKEQIDVIGEGVLHLEMMKLMVEFGETWKLEVSGSGNQEGAGGDRHTGGGSGDGADAGKRTTGQEGKKGEGQAGDETTPHPHQSQRDLDDRALLKCPRCGWEEGQGTGDEEYARPRHHRHTVSASDDSDCSSNDGSVNTISSRRKKKREAARKKSTIPDGKTPSDSPFLRKLYRAETKHPKVSVASLGKEWNEIIENKVINDATQLSNGKRPLPFTIFYSQNFCVRFGKGKKSRKREIETLQALAFYYNKHPRLDQYATLVGINPTTTRFYSRNLSDMYMALLHHFIDQTPGASIKSISEKLAKNMHSMRTTVQFIANITRVPPPL